MKSKTNFFIVGTAKAGTSSLHEILSHHPQINMSLVKEPNFFSKDIVPDNFRKNYREAVNTKLFSKAKTHEMFLRNIMEYEKLFIPSGKDVIGEASVSYLYSEVAAEEIYKYNPNAKILIILRNPVERAFSHFLMNLKTGYTNNLNFLDEIKKDYNKAYKGWGVSHLYIELGLYFNQIKRFMDVFDQNNVLILDFYDFKKNNQNIIDNICSFLGIDDFTIPSNRINLNVRKIPSNKLALLLNSSYKFKSFLKEILNKKQIEVIRNYFLREGSFLKLKEKDRYEISKYFEADLKKLKDKYDIKLK